MFTRPDDLADSDVARALSEGWNLAAGRLEYAAVGFGSHHWRATAAGVRWFVTVDDLEARRREPSETRPDAAARLSAALLTARSLRDAGLAFVVAPTTSQSGAVLQALDDRYVVALYPHVNGETHQSGPYPSHAERLSVLDRIATIHEATPLVAETALADDFLIPRRRELEAAVRDRSKDWGPGPRSDDARRLVDRHADPLRAVLKRYDELTAIVSKQPTRFVLTHGEPHRGNTIDTEDGLALIDWDTALLAPPERDLWALIDEDDSIADDYSTRTGVSVDPVAAQLYRLWWDLCEISLFVAQFRQPHGDTEDLRVAWRGLTNHLDPDRWASIL